MMVSDVDTPVWVLNYQGVNVTQDLAPMVTSVTYTDQLHGESDELEMSIEDVDGRWKGAWYPGQGDLVELHLGYLNKPLLPCGQFRIDEIEAAGPPDTVTLRALAAAITRDLRTDKNRAFEGQTLAGMAAQIAAEHGLTVVGKIADIALERVTQANEPDLAFLKRLAEDYGYAFSVREKTLVFHELADLAAQGAALGLDRKQLKDYRLTDKTRKVYQACEVSYQDPATKETITHRVEAAGIKTGDVLKRKVRVETPADAERKAKAILDSHNSLKTTGTITTAGMPSLVAGINLTLTGLGILSGTYQVTKSTHTIQRSGGYTTSAEIKRV